MISKLLLLIFPTFILTSHFNGGTVTWGPVNATATGSPIQISITQTYSWTAGLIDCSNAMIVNHSLIDYNTYTSLPGQTLSCTGTCNFGTSGNARGYNNSTPIIPYCTDTNPKMGTVIGQRTDIETLYVNDDFTVAFTPTGSQAWIGLQGASASAKWSISTEIDLHLRPDGYYNSAPMATMMSPINIPLNQLQVINIPVSDNNDNDILKCRIAVGSTECGDTCPPGSLPANAVVYPNCTITMTGTTNNYYYAVAIMVEDYYDNSSTTPMSATPVQFLVHVVSASSCLTGPVVIGVPAELSCTPAQVGVPVVTQIVAINYCPSNTNITEISTLSIPGMGKVQLRQHHHLAQHQQILPLQVQRARRVLHRLQHRRALPRPLQRHQGE
ncbi:unnamed protein product [Didymodactylos carnosus]|uniref:Uncharacterized protein n=1 Tax=Didymodactylos carnosus TaxID=1234261 RepID=A0A815GBF1_9BILA|nr:unnamed protein product [Didymodactylos carnosus]CAF4193978.1 unnamed protein product [Didymodactylos carnosus]